MDNPYYNPEIWGGIECTINRVNNNFFDQLNYSGHYKRDGDIDQIAETGIKKIRYPVLWEKHQPEKDSTIDWSWTEKQLYRIKEKNIDVIAGLLHHGSGPSFTNMSDPDFPHLLAEYAGKVAQKFPWINYYTPVNEPLTTARFSGLYGLWYPHERNDQSFIMMLLNELKGVVLSMEAIRKVNPSAKLVQTEDLGKIYSTPKLSYQAKFENERRWLTYDLLCGKLTKKHPLWQYFIDIKIPVKELEFFLENPCIPDLFGFNHYLTSERFLDERLYLYPPHTHGGNGRHKYADVEAVRVEVEEDTGIEALLKEAWERYKQPIAITEVHLHCHREEQLRWFKHVWEASRKLRSEGVDIKAITTWAMLGSYGWNKLLTQPDGDYEPGAFDLRGGTLRPTALAKFIKETAITQQTQHHLSVEKGWWQRSTRLIYEPTFKPAHTNKRVPPVLIIGKNGTLGKAFARICGERCIAFKLLSRKDCDISNLQSIENAIEVYKPWAVINAAGYVRVDDAERDQEACLRDNTDGAKNLAIACSKAGIHLMTFSTDLVFDGKKSHPYVESDPTNPLNIYGLSKARSEEQVKAIHPSSLIIRTSAFFGPWDEYNFAHYIRKSLLQGETVHVANDVVISPTYVPDLVNTTMDILIDNESGIWHMANQGFCTWADFAQELAYGFDLDKNLIIPVSAQEMGYQAKRPNYSVLASERGHLLPSLSNALEQYLQDQATEKRKVA